MGFWVLEHEGVVSDVYLNRIDHMQKLLPLNFLKFIFKIASLTSFWYENSKEFFILNEASETLSNSVQRNNLKATIFA